jgi:hypothetical protein
MPEPHPNHQNQRGLARDHPDQVTCPPKKSSIGVADDESSSRICVERGLAELKARRSLQRWTGCRHHLAETIQAIASLASDRNRTT